MTALTTVLFALALAKTAFAIKCLECVDMPDPQDCLTTTECSAYESCHVTQFITTGGLVLYNSGCMAKNRCSFKKRDALAVLQRRQDLVSNSDIVTCVDCCDSEYCNMAGCGITSLKQPQRGPVCFSCDSQSDPKTCRDVMTCSDTQVCSLSQHYIGRQIVFTSKCDERMRCRTLGKRDQQKRSNFCFKCCEDDFCNQDCGPSAILTSKLPSPTLPSAPPATTSKPTTHRPITLKPSTHKVTTHNPVTHKATTHKPVTHTATTHKPVTHKATTHKPTTHKATTHKPMTHKATTHKPVTHKATTHKPVTNKATTHKPMTHKATTHKPTTHKATTIKPTTHKLTTTTIPLTTKDPEISCKKDNYIFDSHLHLCLKFHMTPHLNWTDALRACEQDNGTLAVITSDTKAKDVQNFISSHSSNSHVAYWVGANDKTQAHVFTWLNGETIVLHGNTTVDFSQANCLFIDGPTTNDLNYESCTQKHAYICEKKNQIRTRSV